MQETTSKVGMIFKGKKQIILGLVALVLVLALMAILSSWLIWTHVLASDEVRFATEFLQTNEAIVYRFGEPFALSLYAFEGLASGGRAIYKVSGSRDDGYVEVYWQQPFPDLPPRYERILAVDRWGREQAHLWSVNNR